MYHSVTFDGKNTWDDWGLIPTSRPLFNPPELKSNYMEIAGRDGSFDLSTVISGVPVYKNRTGSMEFAVVNGLKDWTARYSEIMSYLHGRKCKAILEDDIGYYYEGRFTVNSWKSDPSYSVITIDYNVDPYKYNMLRSVDEWLWDPFNFEDGVIQDAIKNIQVNTDTYKLFEISGLIGRMPVIPKITVVSTDGNGIDFRIQNDDYGVTYETNIKTCTDYVDYDFIMSEMLGKGSTKLYMKGHGSVKLDIRSGRL